MRISITRNLFLHWSIYRSITLLQIYFCSHRLYLFYLIQYIYYLKFINYFVHVRRRVEKIWCQLDWYAWKELILCSILICWPISTINRPIDFHLGLAMVKFIRVIFHLIQRIWGISLIWFLDIQDNSQLLNRFSESLIGSIFFQFIATQLIK